ncbi:uncharacterized protein LOC132168582 [Corylus avellana]|uniref:uncharacterized protein LOC132168582 n=1 Tax=Corylus avellana TaxID=13451 RepID=UPI00286ADF22|nr:uncharacterized protein LOC132168582 [Corylus avellana]
MIFFQLTGIMRSLVLYCYFWKVANDSTTKTNTLQGLVTDLEAENARLKEVVAKQDEELLLLGQQQSIMQAETSEMATARTRAESKATELAAEIEGLRAEINRL